MSNITVLGAGLIGKAIALDLASKHDVTVVDINNDALINLTHRNPAIKSVVADLLLETNIIENIKNSDIVVNAVPGFMGFQTLEKVIRAKKNVVDIAFFPENALLLDSLAKENNVTAIVDMGVAPGLSNLVLGYHSNELDIQYFKCMVGGLPKHPEPPFYYKAPFSPADVIEEYTRPARLVREGQVITLPALSEVENIEFETLGTLEAFNTDGLRTLINSFPDIPNMVEKTLRYPGHASLIQALKDIGYLDPEAPEKLNSELSPLELSTTLFKKHWKLKESEPEFTIMRIEITGRDRQDANRTVSYQYDLYDEYDETTGISSMARTTGYTCTATVNLLLDNHYTRKGIAPPEYIGQNPDCFREILRHYEDHGIRLDRKPG